MSVPRLPTMNVPAPRPPLPKIALEEAFAHKATMTLDAAERYPVARQVVRRTSELSSVWQLEGLRRRIRDVVVGLLSHVGAARKAMANAFEEVHINYQGSPIAVGPRPRGAKVEAGQHLPHVNDPAVSKQLRAVLGADNLGHTILTVATNHPAPAAGGPGSTHVLVTRDTTLVAGYDSVIADPHRAIADRLGLNNGGRVVVRPDGYIGAITTLDDTNTIPDYFTRIAS